MLPEGMHRIRVLFADQFGFARGKYVPAAAVTGEVGFSVTIFGVGYDRDLIPAPGAEVLEGMGDLSALYSLDDVRPSWDDGTGVVIADLERLGQPLAISGRLAARRAIDALAAATGGTPRIGVELEAYVLQPDGSGGWEPWDTPGAYCYGTGTVVDPVGLFDDILAAAEGCGLGIETMGSEYDNPQFELVVGYGDALDALDRAFLLKQLCREVALRHGLLLTFLGRPFQDRGGNGTHFHLSVTGDGDRNLFDDPSAGDGLSDMAHHAIAGVLAHHEALTALCAPTVNAYKRLKPGELAGYWANWGYDHRSVAVRVPSGRGAASRLEHRLPDGAANLYLAAAALMSAARLGIEAGEPAPPAETGDSLETANTERCCPENLSLALDALESDEALYEAVGTEITDHFVAMKRAEWARYARAVTDWELREYLAFH